MPMQVLDHLALFVPLDWVAVAVIPAAWLLIVWSREFASLPRRIIQGDLT